MHFQGTDIPGVQLVSPYIWGDSRKFLTELIGLECSSSLPKFVQDNTSLSEKKHTLRGMHYQCPPHAQAKLVRCSQGEFLDVVVDIRIGSPTFGKCNAVVLSAENRLRLFVPKGFLHGFLTLVDDAVIEYSCSDYFAPECDGSVHWNSLDFDWGNIDPVVSEKDAAAVTFDEFKSPFRYGAEQ
jgi:dTDP-4-dehydrorhamnose 3,5-epimerase